MIYRAIYKRVRTWFRTTPPVFDATDVTVGPTKIVGVFSGWEIDRVVDLSKDTILMRLREDGKIEVHERTTVTDDRKDES